MVHSMIRKFDNNTERAFYDYTLSTGKYKESTVWHYILRLRKIESMDTLVLNNLDPIIADYETGSQIEMNRSCHNAYSCALKRLQEYQEAKGIVVI